MIQASRMVWFAVFVVAVLLPTGAAAQTSALL